MSRNKKDIFKEVISKAESQKPADDTANLVMQQITAVADDEVAISPALKNLLQKHVIDAAPMAFTNNVMAQVNPQQTEINYNPIISKKAWYAIAASILCILILTVVSGGSGQHAFSASIGGNAIKQINAIPPVYIITLIFGGLLPVAEHFITGRLKLSKQ
ncbi:hypothetical protein ACFQZS_12440 [Mucilaginibacter calamicampi]|uniref:Uncharacterized protein n=1 Tax=Mucilaginibacter calamicampi TaxID=1302352 RepID=A0ABW2YZA6_9SPHI